MKVCPTGLNHPLGKRPRICENSSDGGFYGVLSPYRFLHWHRAAAPLSGGQWLLGTTHLPKLPRGGIAIGEKYKIERSGQDKAFQMIISLNVNCAVQLTR